MKITLVQSRSVIGDTKVNYFKAKMRIANIESDIFVFPEMYCSGYVSSLDDINFQNLKALTVDQIKMLSHYSGSTVICGCPSKSENGSVSDCALVIDGQKTYEYAKMNLRSDNVADETKLYVPGNKPLIVDREGLLLGLTVGHDLLLHELCRSYAENKVDILICMAALTGDQMGPFMKLAQARAIEYSIPILLCNMTGPDSGKEMGGLSAFIDENGELIERCTSGSDVREIRIDVEEYKSKTAKRDIARNVSLGVHESVKMETVVADPNAPSCPLFG